MKLNCKKYLFCLKKNEENKKQKKIFTFVLVTRKCDVPQTRDLTTVHKTSNIFPMKIIQIRGLTDFTWKPCWSLSISITFCCDTPGRVQR